MSLFQSAVETYDAHESLVGVMREGHDVPLAPVAHQTTKAQICITLDKDGNFISAEKMDETIIIPVTEESAARTSTGAAEKPHPLCDKLLFFLPEYEKSYNAFLQKLCLWCVSEYSHPKLFAILFYVKQKRIKEDLLNCGILKPNVKDGTVKTDPVVCWKVLSADENPSECWKDQSLFLAFKNYYINEKEKNAKEICFVSGKETFSISLHPKNISSFTANAKLISSNDKNGFTYRGRFVNDTQALTVSYEVSQKAHNVLRWLIAEQGVVDDTVFGTRVFLCWNPKGYSTPSVTGAFRKNKTSKNIFTPSDYRKNLQETLLSYKNNLPGTESVIIAVFDATIKNSGRLSVAYYNELKGSDFLQRLYNWDEKCCWYHGAFGIQSPSLYQIVNTAFGTRKRQKDKDVMQYETDKKLLKQQMQRLVSCRIDRKRIPEDVVNALVNHASNASGCSIALWRETIFVACAVINKSLSERTETNIMEWNLETMDRSFQFGRLLAVMERAELDYYKKTHEDRQTTAIKSIEEYRRKPFFTYERINRHLEQAYLPRLSAADRIRYKLLTSEIIGIISSTTEDLNKPLKDVYLLGYDLQRNAFYKNDLQRKNNAIKNESEES